MDDVSRVAGRKALDWKAEALRLRVKTARMTAAQTQLKDEHIKLKAESTEQHRLLVGIKEAADRRKKRPAGKLKLSDCGDACVWTADKILEEDQAQEAAKRQKLVDEANKALEQHNKRVDSEQRAADAAEMDISANDNPENWKRSTLEHVLHVRFKVPKKDCGALGFRDGALLRRYIKEHSDHEAVGAGLPSAGSIEAATSSPTPPNVTAIAVAHAIEMAAARSAPDALPT
jgi:hypothetical protein